MHANVRSKVDAAVGDTLGAMLSMAASSPTDKVVDAR